MFGGLAPSYSEALLAAYSPGNGLVWDARDNSLVIRDPITPANDYSGPLITAGAVNKGAFTRAGSTATFVNSSRATQTAAANEPRINYNRATGALEGLLMEGARTNLFLNSATLSTQSVTVTAAPHALTFIGTGTITLSGASTAGPLVGTGANNRVQLVFTPSAGSLTCTVAGDVREAQVELGDAASSYIPTAGATVTRNADLLTIENTAFNLTQSVGTLYVRNAFDGGTAVFPGGRVSLATNDATDAERVQLYNLSGLTGMFAADGGASQAVLFDLAVASGVFTKMAGAYASNDFAFVQDGRTPQTDASGTLPTTTRLSVGSGVGTPLFGPVSGFAFFGTRISNANLQSLTA